MKLPCVKRISWVVRGLTFLQPALTSIQFVNITLVATALILGSRFKLTEIISMWLKRKAVSTLSYFFADAKLSIADMQRPYLVRVLSVYNLGEEGGYFIIDDTMNKVPLPPPPNQLFSYFISLIQTPKHGVFVVAG